MLSGERGARWDWAAVQPCGTRAAYKRHKRYGEEACVPCKQANARYKQDRAMRARNTANCEQRQDEP